MPGKAAIAGLFFLPWLDRSRVKSIRYRGWIFKTALSLFTVAFLVLGYLGALPPSPRRTAAAQIYTLIYFGYLLLMPICTKFDPVKAVPERVKRYVAPRSPFRNY